MKYRYQAFDRAGASRSAVIEAASPADASEMLRREGLFVSSVAATDEASGAGSWKSGGFRLRIGFGTSRIKSVANFTRQMSVLVGTGTRVADALLALERQTRDARFRETVAGIRRKVEEGGTLSDAMGSYGEWFDPIAVSLVRAGESSGRLDQMLHRLSEISLQRLRTRQSVASAMVYPLLLIKISIGVLTTMLLFVLPRFTGLFTTLQVPLPPTTKALMAASEFLVSYWWLVVSLLVGSVAFGVFWYRSRSGRASVDRAFVSLPFLARITRSFATARLSRVLGLLMDARVPLLEALDLTKQSLHNGEHRKLLDSTAVAVQRGDSLSACLGVGDLIEPSVIEALKNAERTGQIGTVLISMADFLDEENRTLVKSITSLVEPAILITLGVIVGFIATSLFLPLFDLTAAAGGGGGGAS